MNEVWNLDPIYPGFDAPEFRKDLEELKNTVAAYTAWVKTLDTLEPLEGLKTGTDYLEQLFAYGNKLVEYCMLRQAANTLDGEASSGASQVMGLLSTMAGPKAIFKDWAAKLPDLMELVASDEVLKEYTFLYSNILSSSSFQLPGMGEEIMAKMELSGSSAWGDLQQFLTSTVPVQYRGEKTNLSAIRNLAYDPDPAVRKDAYEAELNCYERISDSVAFALNSIKLETLTDCELRGYESPLDRTLKEAHMSRATLDAMLGAMDEYLPKFWQYLKAKGKALGHENGLPWYDLFAPMGAMAEKYTAEGAREYLVDLFTGFDQELADMVARAFDNAWIDFYPRSGKSGGAFCSGVDCLHESRILTNFDGQFGDVVTLAHELGHAFHNQCIDSHRVLNHDYSMPLAETASTFNECVIMNAAIKAAKTDEEKLALIESQLQDATQVICDIYSRYRFETMVFEKRKEEFLHSGALCDLMTQAQKLSYGDGLDGDVMHPYMWVCKSHYYGPTFYNFPYAFGALFARGLYAQYEREGAAFVPKYKKLLYTTAIATAEDTAKVADIDLTDRDFWRSALQMLADEIDLFCELVEKK
ncbi:MAG: M3 family oligoendopeptidase [Oscillospiraceae bacterium]|nr:M3 family oligoendopeptidase [Oscillospiraceae bacterium]